MARTGKLTLGVVAAGLAVVLAVTVLALLATAPADAASKYKVVTKTFSDSQPITIPSLGQATPYPSEMSIGGAFGRGRIKDVNLTLKNFSHEFEQDVDVLLAKAATNRTVMSDVNTVSPTTNVTLVLDDEAANSFPAGILTGGTYKPANFDGSADVFPAPAPTPSGASELGGFDGQRAKGTWKLFVVDDITGGEGQFAGGWSLKIKARVLR